ncbi:pectate lyase family protein [Plebeiibacterium sediminum]|uniref:Pectate lyase n=1 Tax=Plebeiibacterium sediminum TaxID=2992112 RepID=A0AAE3SG04_9BACT|nr:pectate lyase [Plebeiobacterium sediminum]MCW3787980.1 pectate lyase [Plebeiobacterium sediminum]
MKNILYCLVILTFSMLISLGCEKDEKWANSPVTSESDDDTKGGNNNAVVEDPYAFPGAEGGGMNATGGRGGDVYKVTSVEDTNTPGTLRYAINQEGARIVVFDVAGTIHLKSSLSIDNNNITIAGQTAPGEGVTLADFPVTVNADNVIIRFIRFRMGDKKVFDAGVADGADALGGRQHNNIIVDHCSVSWCTDECCSFYDNENFTLQWSIISESLRLSKHSKGPHGYGAIWGGVNASFHHNLMAHHDSRTPRFGPGAVHAGTDRVDVRNNVFYNWNGNGCYGGEAMHINIVNNYYKPGPGTADKVASRIMQIDVSGTGGYFEEIIGVWGRYFISGNVFPYSSGVTANNWTGINIYQKDGFTEGTEALLRLYTDVETDAVTTHDAETAYEKVLAYAGSSLVRDAVDNRIVNEVTNGTAAYKGLNEHNGYGTDFPGSDVNWKSTNYPRFGIIDSQDDTKPEGAGDDWSAWPDLDAGTPLVDTDNDGMPDQWETDNGLDPKVKDHKGRNLSTAYDNIEVYINSLVSDITDAMK